MINKQIVQLFLATCIVSFNQGTFAETTTLSLLEEKKLTLKQQLGMKIFFDANLSTPAGQSCANCHDIKTSFTEPNQNSPVSFGVVSGRTGTRNTPSVGYSAFSPNFYFDPEEELYIGGQFLDGRAENLKEQAKAPFLNPDEMNNIDEQSVIEKIKKSGYAGLFKQVFGENVFTDANVAFDSVAQAIVAFENTTSFNRFSSKYDYFLAGFISLSEQEQKGLELFEDENKGNCSACHISKTDDGSMPLFTDFTYDNLGTPSNPDILAIKGDNFVDFGLGETVGSEENGKFKVPSLRNVSKTAPYMHNGVFSDLKEVVDFYNTRDVDSKWGSPEVAENVNTDELGDLKLTDEEVDAIIAFMQTLTDGYVWQDKPVFSAIKGIIEMPLIRAEGVNQTDRFYSAQLDQTEKGTYQITSLEEKSINNLSMLKSMPYYSFDTGRLELPEISSMNINDQISTYTGQLKSVSTESGKIEFELLFSKKLQ